MDAIEIDGPQSLEALVGERAGPTAWRTVSQEMIDQFATLSGDDQWIHVDVERAGAESPYGTTIAHGNLTLSLVDGFRRQLLVQRGFKLGINYGWDKVRFPAPVPAGSKVRATASIVRVEEIGDGWWHSVARFSLEVDGSEKPCCVADSVTRLLAE